MLSEQLSCLRVRPNGTYRHRPGDLVVNWGNSGLPTWGTQRALSNMLNKPAAVANASEKTRTFQILQTVMPNNIPPWTTNRATATAWLSQPVFGNARNAVVCRTLTRANSGRGIVLASNPAEVVAAPLYTRYKPKSAEFRIHVSSRYGVFDAVQKRRRNGAADASGVEKYIRSYDNGWVFCREGVVVPTSVKEAAEEAVAALGLDFGAVDIGYHDVHGITIYEVNTAPGIEGQTLQNYGNILQRHLQA
jgi:hypothetical protein